MKAKRSVAKVSNPMKLLALLFVGLFFLSVLPVASASEWSYRKAITIDHENVVADLADFPALISMTDAELRDKAQPDGDDILFVNADNTIKWDHEIEYFNDSTGGVTGMGKGLFSFLYRKYHDLYVLRQFRMWESAKCYWCLGFQIQARSAFG